MVTPLPLSAGAQSALLEGVEICASTMRPDKQLLLLVVCLCSRVCSAFVPPGQVSRGVCAAQQGRRQPAVVCQFRGHAESR